MFSPYLAGSFLLFAQPILGQFNLYPAVSSKALAAALNISSTCLAAMNDTVNCDQSLFEMVGNADGFFWSDENATALCTQQCLSSASSWWSKSTDACANDQLNAYGRVRTSPSLCLSLLMTSTTNMLVKLYPAETVPGRFIDGLNIVCLTADTDITQDVGINGTVLSFTNVGGEKSTVDTSSDPQSLPDTLLKKRQASGSSSYCIVQSYDWVGSDIIRPDCDNSANANLAQCLDPTNVPAENARLANLYPDSLLCSDCFLKMFYLRLASPYLPNTDHSDYMISQWFDMLDVCNAKSKMPELLVRSLPYYQVSPDVANLGNATDEIVMPIGANNTCTGRVVAFANLAEPTMDPKTQSPCDVVPPLLKASTGDVMRAMHNPACIPNFNTTVIPSICLPLECQVGKMPDNTTW
jgi:hypothetical protein